MNSKVFRNLSYGMYLIAGEIDGRKTGCIVNTVFQITSEPAMIAVSVNKDNYTNEVIRKSGRFSVCLLTETVQKDVIGEFGFKSGRDVNKFEKIPYDTVSEGLPILKEGLCGWFVCHVRESVDMSTHTVFFAEVTDGDIVPGDAPMTYAYYHAVMKGKSPKNAPTYEKHEEKKADAPENTSAGNAGSKVKYVCSVCGYEYEGDTPFEELPDSWVCPVCGEPKSSFEAVPA